MDQLIDGDIIAFRAAAATDGRMYVLKYKDRDGTPHEIREAYKKDIVKITKSLETEGATDIGSEIVYEPEPLSHALFLVDKALVGIKMACTGYYKAEGKQRIFLSRGGSFREDLYPSYKSNREGMRRPKHLEAIKDHLEKEHGAISGAGALEADDLMAINQGINTVICSIDKDLLQVPGSHYNFVSKEFSVVTEVDGNRNLYGQMLTGDTADGIVGLHGVGPVTAKKMLVDVQNPHLMYLVVLKAYYDKTERLPGEEEADFQSRVLAMVRMNATLLYLLRAEGDKWEVPKMEESL